MSCNPLHTATINGRQVRFFRSLLTEPDFPWDGVVDLLRARDFADDEAERALD